VIDGGARPALGRSTRIRRPGRRPVRDEVPETLEPPAVAAVDEGMGVVRHPAIIAARGQISHR